MLDLDTIEAAARAATPGPWEVGVASNNGIWIKRSGKGTNYAEVLADATHISTVDPSATLALVAELRAKRERVRLDAITIKAHAKAADEAVKLSAAFVAVVRACNIHDCCPTEYMDDDIGYEEGATDEQIEMVKEAIGSP